MKPELVAHNEAYATHLPMLFRCVEISDHSLPIVEFGMGFSTFFLDMLCRKEKRRIVSYENDPEWFEKNKEFSSDFHEIHLVDDWASLPVEKTHWGVAFIDHRPARRRRHDALRLRNAADYIILHDTEPEVARFYGYSRIYPHFSHRKVYTGCMPNTTVLSNRYTLDNL